MQPWKLAVAFSLFAMCIAAFTGCATPTERIEQRARGLQFQRLELEGISFRHAAFTAGLTASSDVLHVYIEHDGTPWIDGGTRPADDPTPRAPLALELMSLDEGPRLYLGRPCYLATSITADCTALIWTHRRYAPEVVDSMVAALREFLAKHPFRHVVLIGHSGGGTIAWLMAHEMHEVSHVYTVAANLDVDYWAAIHGYSALQGSLNPARLSDLPSTVVQVNYVGGGDDQVPPRVVESFARTHPNARTIVIGEFDHRCCWSRRWPNLLTDNRRIAQ